MNYKILILFIPLFYFFGCSVGKGPAFFNDSGGTIEIIACYEDGHRIVGSLDSGVFLWAGYLRAPISSATVTVAGISYSLGTEELRSPIPGDNWAAFVVRSDGVHKIKLSEAREMAEMAANRKKFGKAK